MVIHDVLQRSPEWHALRLGKLTASKSGDMMARTSKGWSTSRRNLLMQLVLERVTGRSQERTHQTQAMQDGIEREPIALARYEMLTGITVQQVGFCSHDDLMAGCSPDGLIEDDGLISIKCPIEATHWEYLKTGVIPESYVWQMTHEMWLTGRQWCDFMSYQPYFPSSPTDLRVKLIRFTRVESEIAAYDKAVRAFLAEVDTEFASIKTLSSVTSVFQESLHEQAKAM